jgi:hypothetical protein
MFQSVRFFIFGLFFTCVASKDYQTFSNYGSYISVDLKINEAEFSPFNFTIRCSKDVHNYHQTWTITNNGPVDESVMSFNKIFEVPEVTRGAICYGEHNLEFINVNINAAVLPLPECSLRAPETILEQLYSKIWVMVTIVTIVTSAVTWKWSANWVRLL